VAAVKRILVIRRDNIGDLVCTTPLLYSLKMHYADSRIDVLANTYNAPVLEGNRSINSVYVYEKLKHAQSAGAFFAAGIARAKLLWSLRQQGFDIVVLAGGPQDVRGARIATALSPSRLVSTEAYSKGTHEVERVFSAARLLGIREGIPSLKVSALETEVAKVRQAISSPGSESNLPLIAVHISARRRFQRWPTDRFAALVAALHDMHGARVALLWSPGPDDHPQHPGDDGKARAILRLLQGKSWVLPWPTTHLRQLIAVLSECRGMICSDGGAMHIAAGLGKPIVCFFGDSPVDRWRPWGVPHTVLQAESHRVEDITLDSALKAAEMLFASGGAK
jgi:ADP-heptose:LPS heptosyltransferase